MASRQATTAQIIANTERAKTGTIALTNWEQYRAAVLLNVRQWRPAVEALMFENWCAGISIRATISEINDNESIK